MKILFIIKQFYDYDGELGSTPRVSSGLRTSAEFVIEMLRRQGVDARLAIAVDGNSINALVAKHRPSSVVIEALWVVPAKLAELKALWPAVKWTVRSHSELPFLAQEGCAMQWLAEYEALGVERAFNSAVTARDLYGRWLPNWYPLCERRPYDEARASNVLHVGCFGAVRPFKNQLIQAVAAVGYARSIHKPLAFHMNIGRIEQFGTNNLKNIAAYLAAAGANLTLHPWAPHDEFMKTVVSMDVCLQVSLTESFNVVSADAVDAGIPLVGSAAIDWLPARSKAPVNSARGIAEVIAKNVNTLNVQANYEALSQYLHEARHAWLAWV